MEFQLPQLPHADSSLFACLHQTLFVFTRVSPVSRIITYHQGRICHCVSYPESYPGLPPPRLSPSSTSPSPPLQIWPRLYYLHDHDRPDNSNRLLPFRRRSTYPRFSCVMFARVPKPPKFRLFLAILRVDESSGRSCGYVACPSNHACNRLLFLVLTLWIRRHILAHRSHAAPRLLPSRHIPVPAPEPWNL